MKTIKTPETPQDWLKSWKASVGTIPQEEKEIDLSEQPVIDYDTVRHLQQLYREQPVVEDGMR